MELNLYQLQQQVTNPVNQNRGDMVGKLRYEVAASSQFKALSVSNEASREEIHPRSGCTAVAATSCSGPSSA